MKPNRVLKASACLVGVFVLTVGISSLAQSGVRAELQVAVAVSSVQAENGEFTAVYSLGLINSGDTALRDLAVTLDLAAAFPAPATYKITEIRSNNLTTVDVTQSNLDGEADALMPGNTLLPRQEAEIVVSIYVSPNGSLPPYVARFVVAGVTAEGAAVEAVSTAEILAIASISTTEGEKEIDSLPQSCLGSALDVVKTERISEGTYEVEYMALIANCGESELRQIQATENLSTVLSAIGSFEIQRLSSSTFEINPDFDGEHDIRLLRGDDTLLPGEEGSIRLSLIIVPAGDGVRGFRNRFLASGLDEAGRIVIDLSEDGANPDPDDDGDPTNNSRSSWVGFAEAELTGTFSMTASLTDDPSLTLADVALNVFLTLEGFTAQLTAAFADGVFDTLNLKAAGTLGGLSLNSSVAFDPSALAFKSWQNGVAFSVMEIDFTDVVSITPPQTSSYNQLAISGSAGPIAFQGTIKLGLCPLAFWAANLCGSFDWTACSASVSVCLLFSDAAGFESLSISMSDLVLFEDLFGVEGTLSTTLLYTESEKSLTPSIKLVPDWLICPEIELLGEITLASSPIGITGISLYGIQGEVPIGDSVTFSFTESFDPDKDQSVTGSQGYFESYSIAVGSSSCCASSDFSLEGSVFFARDPGPSGALFGADLLTLSATVPFNDSFTFVLGFDFDLAAATWVATFGFEAVW